MSRRTRGNGPKNPNGPGSGSDTFRTAQRDVMQSLHPYLFAIRQSRQQANRDTAQHVTQIGEIGSTLQSQLGALDQPFQDTMSGISSGLSSDIANLSPLMTQSSGAVPAAERAAGSAMVGTTGAGTLEQLASSAARGASYNTSAERQGAIEQNVTSRNALNDLANFKQDAATKRLDTLSQAPSQIRQREDQLAQQAFDRRMALESMAINQGQFGLQTQAFDLQASQAAQLSALLADPRIAAFIRQHPELASFFGG